MYTQPQDANKVMKAHIIAATEFCLMSLLSYTYSAKGSWNKSLNFIFPTKYVIPKSLKVSHWLSEYIHKQIYIYMYVQCNVISPIGLSCDHRFSRFSHGLRSTSGCGCGAHGTNTACEKEGQMSKLQRNNEQFSWIIPRMEIAKNTCDATNEDNNDHL